MTDYLKYKAALSYVERSTHLRTKAYRMMSDGLQGDFLQALSLAIAPRAVLEVGTFTGYASLCLARGLAPDGRLDTIEIDDELTDIALTAFEMAGLASQICFHAGDAARILPTLKGPYDIIYIDADKREYPAYYDLVYPLLRPGGCLLADNVLWNGRGRLAPSTGEAAAPPPDKKTAAILDFNRRMAADTRFDSLILPIRDGLALAWKNRS